MKLNRRRFLIGGGVVGGGLVLGFSLTDDGPVPGLRDGTFQPNGLLQITSDNEIIFQMARAEMGQGVYSGMTTIIAEELDVDPLAVTVELAGVHSAFAVGFGQVTGGSTSTPLSWDVLREAGAGARAMLVAAAAKHWRVEPSQVATDNGRLINLRTDERLDYGAVAETAKNMAGDVDFELKARKDYRWIGKSARRNDSFIKSTGKAEFGMDVRLPGMKTAIVVRPPQFGGSVKSWNGEMAREQPGVHKVFEVHSGVAIVAETYWEARKAADALNIEWEKGPLAGLNSQQIHAQQQQAIKDGDPYFTVEEGDTEQAVAEAATALQAEYSAPFLPHSTMEPQNATAVVRNGKLEVWAPNQGPDITRAVAASFSEFEPEDITIHSTLLGGGFGRRAYVDFVGEVVAVAQRVPDTPVKLIWSREDDMQHDFYRPASYHSVRGALDADGKLLAWDHKVASSSLIKGMATSMMSMILPSFVPPRIARSVGRFVGNLMDDYDPTISEGAEVPYAVPNLTVSQVLSEQGIPVGFWRSVGSSHTAFVSESFMDEMAHAAGADPVAFRRRHLADKPRHLAVLELAVENAGWGQSADGVYQGVALHSCFDSYVAMVVDVSVQGSDYAVERVVAAVDCGLPVTPDIVRAQVESAIVYGLSGATKGPVTIEDGAVKQSNFHDAPVTRINEVPTMEVHIVASQERPTGIGEPGLPPVAPALSNALFAATGQRLRDLPLTLS